MSWFWWALLAAGFAALTGLFIKLGVSDTHPDVATLVRSVVITLLLLGVITLTGRWAQVAQLRSATVGWLVLAGVAACASWICHARALQVGPLGLVATVDKTAFVLALLLGVLVLSERPSLYEWLSVGVILIGVILLQLAQRSVET